MKPANEALYDATIRHQIKLLRYSEGQARDAARILLEADAQLEALLKTELTEATEARLRKLLVDIRKQREAMAEALGAEIEKDSEELALNEATWEIEAIQASSPVQLKLNAVAPATLKALTGKPINGVPLSGWLGTMTSGDVTRIEQQLRLGITQGETLDQLVGRIRGTKANNYTDGVTSVTRRNAQTIARTAANHVSNSARQEVWNANADIIQGVRWTATLDGRTSDVCRGRDGVVYPINEGPRPPGHPGCRSTTVPILDGDEIVGDRPFVRDTRTRAQRETDFRKEAQEKAGDKWKGMTKEQRQDAIRAEREAWTKANIGQVPTTETYDSWLRKQPREFQDEVLGKEKGKMFRDGMTMDKFIDEKGKPYTIKDLKAATQQDMLNVVQPGVGMKAKALLQQGMSTPEVLEAIKKEYPDANTSAASIASYKTELKKAGALDQLVGKVSTGGVKQALAVQDVVSNMEANLPAGLKHAIGGQWANVVEDLDGTPGAYGYYQAGKGVQLSGKKLSAIHPMQAQQVIAHELGHLLHKQHDVKLDPDWQTAMDEAKGYLTTDGKKNYGYYLASKDELTAEIYAQALSPSPLTSQGLSALEFNNVFKAEIDEAKKLLQDKFPVPHAKAPPPIVGAPTEVFEVAGQHKTVGGLAKALLQQGLNDEAVLAAVKVQFPDAKTSKASLASYKVDLKKAGLLPAKGSGPTVVAKAVPGVTPPPPSPAMQQVVKEQAAAGVQMPVPSLYGKTLTPDQEDALDYAVNKFEEAIKDFKLKTLDGFKGLEDMRDIMGLSLPPAQVNEVLALAKFTVMEKAAKKAAKKVESALPLPKLANTQLGNFSSQMLAKLKGYFAGGGDVPGAHKILQSAFGTTYKEAAGMDLIDLAKYEVTTGKKVAKSYLSEAQEKALMGTPAVKKLPQPGDPEYPAWIKAQADAKAAAEEAKKEAEMYASTDMTPARLAASPRQAFPPPPRFTAQQRLAAIRRYGANFQPAKAKKANAEQAKLGLPELTLDEVSAIVAYTSNLYTRLNQPLRGGQFQGDFALQAFVEAAQSGLRKMPKFKGLTSRGMTIPADRLEKVLSAYTPGSIVEEHAFISTSAGDQAAFGGNVFMKILGKNGVDVSGYSHYPGEREVLYAPGTRLRVKRVEQVGGKYIITLEEVDD